MDNTGSLPCRKCPKCLEILDPKDFAPHASYCRGCDAERQRKRRKSASYRVWLKHYLKRPDVVERRRASERERIRIRVCRTSREKMLRHRSVARAKALRYEAEGKPERAAHQWDLYHSITAELERQK